MHITEKCRWTNILHKRGHMLSWLIGEETVNLECPPVPSRLSPPLLPPPELKTASKLDWTWEWWAMSRALCLMRTFIFILHRSAHMCLPRFRQHCDSETFEVRRMAPEKTDVLRIRNCLAFIVKESLKLKSHEVCLEIKMRCEHSESSVGFIRWWTCKELLAQHAVVKEVNTRIIGISVVLKPPEAKCDITIIITVWSQSFNSGNKSQHNCNYICICSV